MKLFLNCVFFISLSAIHFSYGRIETCSSSEPNFRFSSHFISYKDDGRTYRCKCIGIDCEKIRCRKIRTVNAISEVIATGSDREEARTDGITVIEQAFFNSSEELRIEAESNACQDPKTGTLHARGSSFVSEQPGSPRQFCECPFYGTPEISCTPIQCRMPDPPYNQRSIFSQVNNCFDSWRNREVAHGTTYNRTQMMNLDGRTTAKFQCSCLNTVIRCIAVDVPCCDLETSQFVRKNQRFLTVVQGKVHRCTCGGGKGSGNACIPIEDEQMCIDKQYPRIQHAVNSRWIQKKGNAVWSCTCLRIRATTLGVKCNLRRLLTRRQRSHSTDSQPSTD